MTPENLDRELAYDFYECMALVSDFHDTRELIHRRLQMELTENPSCWTAAEDWGNETFKWLIRVLTRITQRHVAEMVRAILARDAWLKSIEAAALQPIAAKCGRPRLEINHEEVLRLYSRHRSTRLVGQILGIGKNRVAEAVRASRKKGVTG